MDQKNYELALKIAKSEEDKIKKERIEKAKCEI